MSTEKVGKRRITLEIPGEAFKSDQHASYSVPQIPASGRPGWHSWLARFKVSADGVMI